ncbi:MAG TPA: GTP-binding protein, partial [Candidatus Nanoarchaeia archaeon]|nr:GTP-binding protein [Candidatus Nanoarchaeia archaeon]
MAKGKPHMNIVFIGHVDHGKSTTVGRLLYDTGNIDEQAMRKLKETA